MYGYGSVLAARNAFEYGETAISIDLLLYPKNRAGMGVRHVYAAKYSRGFDGSLLSTGRLLAQNCEVRDFVG